MSHCPDCQADHLPNDDGSKEAMAAGYAQGVEVTEAKAIRRITELETALAELAKLSVAGKDGYFKAKETAEKLLRKL